jgi:tRNA nucleotidyltransferase (CCA-adding enzyme)
MPDYIYLLENRLSADQRYALRQLREAAREEEMILFLTGDAVRDLTSGHAVRDLEVAVHGNALKLKKSVEKLGGTVWGESESTHSLYLCFPGTVRVDVISTHRMDYSKLDKPVYHPASIQEDLRRRDFTVNAMAISLNEGSFGLLMDPLNGAADIESRTLRLVSNYGFLEEPSLLIRATRYIARLGWEMDPKTRTRFDNAKDEGVMERLSAEARSRELEQIGHEADGLKVLRTLEDEGWMKFLFPPWTAAKADEEKLKALHDLAVELLMQGVHPDMSAAQMQLLTAKLAAKDLATLKQLMLRRGFVEEWNSLDALAAKFAKVLLSKEHSTASAGYKLFTSYDPEAVLWLAFSSKDKAVQDRFHLFLKVWPEARQRIPHALMQEMRITSELPTYTELVQAIFLELIDGRLTTPEETRTYLEPHSPPAPPPKEVIKRPRAKRGEAKLKERAYDDDEESEDGLDEDEELDDLGGDEDEIDLGLSLPKSALDAEIGDEVESEAESAEDDLDDDLPPPVKRGQKPPAASKGEKATPAAIRHELAEKHQPPVHQPPVKEKAGSIVEPTGKHSVANPKPAAVVAKNHAPHAKDVHGHVPVKAAAPVVKKTAPAPAAKKEEKVSKSAPSSVASKTAGKAPVKANHGSNAHGVKHVQAKAAAKPTPAVKHKAAEKHKPVVAKGKPFHKTAPKPSKTAPPAKAKKPAHKPSKKH